MLGEAVPPGGAPHGRLRSDVLVAEHKADAMMDGAPEEAAVPALALLRWDGFDRVVGLDGGRCVRLA